LIKAVEDYLIPRLSEYGLQDEAAFVLGRIGSEKAVKPLLTTLIDGDWIVRQSAAAALGEIGSEKAVEPLLAALRDEDRFVRRCAARALGEIGSEKAVEPLLVALRDKYRFVRRSAAEALGKLAASFIQEVKNNSLALCLLVRYGEDFLAESSGKIHINGWRIFYCPANGNKEEQAQALHFKQLSEDITPEWH
jgi:hypothetical protein